MTDCRFQFRGAERRREFTVDWNPLERSIPLDKTGPDHAPSRVGFFAYLVPNGTGPGGVHVLDETGRLLDIIRMPEMTRNFCFGGRDGGDFFLAASTTIFRLRMRTAGILPHIAE
ncbi:hypothetical protein [Rhizobium binxianense]